MSPATVRVIKGCPRDKWDEVQAIQTKPFIYIHYNGSKWAGQEADDVDVLVDVLGRYALDRSFSKYGGFITLNPCAGVINPKWTCESGAEKWIDGPRLYPHAEVVHFSGNFFRLSHAFAVDTNEPATIAKLTAAIEVNMKFRDYLSQEDPCQPSKAKSR